MLEQPCLELSIQPCDSDHLTGPLAGRSRQFVESWRQHTGIREPVQLDITEAPLEHVGLGLGTQLGLTVALALDTLFGRTEVPIVERAMSVGRGLRSAVGAHGFQRGGLIVESGKRDDDALGKLEAHVALPTDWHVLLIRTREHQGLAGTAEVQAFRELSSLGKHDKTEALHHALFSQLLPAAQANDFVAFSEAVFHYGLKAGEMFADAQGGAYLNETIAGLVDFCRSKGVQGVGQSSWGPTVFCWFEKRSAAEEFMSKHLLARDPNLEAELIVSAVSREGAQVTVS